MNNNSSLKVMCLVFFCLLIALSVKAQLVIPDEIPDANSGKKQKQYDQLPQKAQSDNYQPVQIHEKQEGNTFTEGLVIKCPKQAELDVPVQIVVNATNPSRTSNTGTVSVSFAGLEPDLWQKSDSFDWLPANADKKAALFEKRDDFWVFRNQIVSVKNTLIELYKSPWKPTSPQNLSFAVTFQQRGTARLFIRASFSTKEGKVTTITDNIPIKGTIDQQGLPCVVYEISVE